MGSPLSGVFPVFQTPFREDDTIDSEVLAAEIEWMYGHGIDGIVMAMVSEVLRLSGEERHELARLSCEYGLDHGPVVVSVGAESTSVALGFARHAENVGASAVMAIPPMSVSAGEAELYAYYQSLLEAVEIPVLAKLTFIYSLKSERAGGTTRHGGLHCDSRM